MNTEKYDIIIAGAGLTGLTLAYYLKKQGRSPLILEKAGRPGGVIRTHTENGFTYESGPNTGVLGNKEIAMLFEELDGHCTLETGNSGAAKRYILKNGKWQALPSGLFSAVSTPLFTLRDKFRILGEPFRKQGTNPDESVADMVKRRLGKSFLDYAVDPFISGIYAGDPSRLVTRYALPKLYALEQNYGSFIRGSVKKGKEKKSEDEKKATREVFSVRGGLGNLITALEQEIGGERIIYGVKDLKASYTGNGFSVAYAGKSRRLECTTFITTTGGFALPEILTFVAPEELAPVTALQYARVAQVAVGYNRWKGLPLELVWKTDDEITGLALDEIRTTLHEGGQPDLLKVFRYEKAIPQYEVSTGERLDCIMRLEQKYPGLILAGNIRDGIGMADRVKQAKGIAEMLAK
jgi:oxygen-dependent protoporphyrinogen oxidase